MLKNLPVEAEFEQDDAPIEDHSAREFYEHHAEGDREISEDRLALRTFALDRMNGFWLRGIRILAQYDGNRNMALDCFLLALGQGEMIPVPQEMKDGPKTVHEIRTATQIAVKHFRDVRKKAAVTKCIKMFQDVLNIGPMPGQRKEEGRVSMGRARQEQLKK